jgi:hypothetical protein
MALSATPERLEDRLTSLLPDAASVYLSLASLEEADAGGLDLPPLAERGRVVSLARQLAAELALVARLAERQSLVLGPLPFLLSLEHSLLLLVEHEGEVVDLPLLTAQEVELGLATVRATG